MGKEGRKKRASSADGGLSSEKEQSELFGITARRRVGGSSGGSEGREIEEDVTLITKGCQSLREWCGKKREGENRGSHPKEVEGKKEHLGNGGPGQRRGGERTKGQRRLLALFRM